MLSFILRRLVQAILVMLFLSLICFSVQNQIGDPVRDLVGERVSPAQIEKIRDRLGLNDPFLVQYTRFLKNALKGNIGYSYFYKKSAVKVILAKAPATFELVISASFIILLISFPAGIYAAIKPERVISKLVMGLSTFGLSIPVFLTAIMLVYFFSVHLDWLPSFGRGELVNLWGWESGLLTPDGRRHLILPAIALSSIMLPLFIRLIRSEMMEVLETEYIRFAWAKGLSKRRIWLLHALKNAILPVVTVGGVQIGVMIAYTILTETVFQYQGLGFLFLEAVERADTSLIVAYVMMVGLLFVIVNTIVDLIYGFINPRIRVTVE